MSKTTSHVSRVDQLDAVALDEELLRILRSNLAKAFDELHPSWLVSVEPELTAFLRLILWKLTIGETGASLGQRLFHLQYQEASGGHCRRQVWCLAGVEIGTQWLCDRIRMGLLNRLPPGTRDKTQKLWTWLQMLSRLASLFNTMAFLRWGQYRSLSERLLGIASSNSRPQFIRQVQYEYMNRELLWHGLADFLTFILSLVNVRRLGNRVGNFLWPARVLTTSPLDRTHLDLTTCALCSLSPTLPHDIGCKHVFCHYCIQSNVLADSSYRCPKCCNQANGVSSVRPVTVTLNPD